MEFIGGLIGVSQDHDTLQLRPEIGWAIRDKANTADQMREPAVPEHPHEVY